MQDNPASVQQGAEQPSELPMIDIVRCEKKGYLRNTRKLRCSKVEVCMSAEQRSRVEGTGSQPSDRRQKSSGCSRTGGTNQLHFGVERERHSGCPEQGGRRNDRKKALACSC